MKRLLLISMILGVLPMTVAAQVDDLYFVPKKKTVEKVTDNYGMPRDTYYAGSNRSVDDYNRRVLSHYEPIANDSTVSDTISFSAEKGVYPSDSIMAEDFQLTKEMSRFDDYQISDNAAFWAGYNAGRYDWAWHSPWYYGRYGFYSGWYDPWYYYDPIFYGSWGYYGYYGWHSPWSYGWYDPWYGPWEFNSWYYDRYYPFYAIGGGGHYRTAPTIGAGTIRRDGSNYIGYRGGTSARNASRMSELRNRTVNGNSRNGRANRSTSSRTTSGNSRYNGSYNNSGSYSSSRSSGSFSGSRISGSSSGGFSGGSRSGGSSGGGGGARMGGRR
ncbi:MAG: hypothetical protein IJV25_02135 [Prevotella sp.]|nr:hypothetical protein [Prevotella sp.]